MLGDRAHRTQKATVYKVGSSRDYVTGAFLTVGLPKMFLRDTTVAFPSGFQDLAVSIWIVQGFLGM